MSLILRAQSEKGNPNRIRLTSPLFNRAENIGDSFGARFCAEIAFAVDADAHCIGVHVALSDHEQGVNFQLLDALSFGTVPLG